MRAEYHIPRESLHVQLSIRIAPPPYSYSPQPATMIMQDGTGMMLVALVAYRRSAAGGVAWQQPLEAGDDAAAVIGCTLCGMF